jgi:peptidoglycan/xylan/chitin deacetylase (PgdA/CDA1 family)
MRRLGLVIALALACAAPAGAGQRTLDLPVLMYHRIGPVLPTLPPVTQRLTVDPKDFAAQMRWLKAQGYHAVSAQQAFAALEHGAKLPPKPVMITFDDGYRDVLWNAAPLLAHYHMRATAYVITGRISGPDSSFLTWPELTRLQRLGVEIGSHTVHHLELPSLSAAAALAELVDSRRALEHHLGHPVQWFSFPDGAADSAVLPLVREAGYVLAVTTRPGAVQSARRPFELHRDEILHTTTLRGFAALLSGTATRRAG